MRGEGSGLDPQEGLLPSVKDWVEATSQLLLTQSSLEQLSASDVDTIMNQLRSLISTAVGSLEAISAVCDAVDLSADGFFFDQIDTAKVLLPRAQ